MMEEIKRIAAIIKRGGIVLCPTDTIWGLSCDATNEAAVARIQKIKGRPSDKSFIVLVKDINQLQEYAAPIPQHIDQLLGQFSKPTTVVYEKGTGLAKGVCASSGSVAVRIVQHAFCKQLINELGVPIVSTSANFSGQIAGKTAKDIDPELKKQVDAMVDAVYEEKTGSKSSAIIKWSGSSYQVIR